MTVTTAVDLQRTQTRTVRLLMLVEVISGLGVAMGISVGALLAKDIAGVALSGMAQSAAIIGGALLAVPAASVMSRYGRRPGLAGCYLIGTVGGVVVVGAAMTESVPLLFLGFFLFGAGNTAKFQARYAAVDLAVPERRGAHLSLVVWATTIGAVLGPLLAIPVAAELADYGLPPMAGPFAFAGLAFLLSSVLLLVFLRPDPLLLAQRVTVDPTEPVAEAGTPVPKLAAAWRAVLASPPARLGVVAMATGHLVMVAVMAMTPVHISNGGHSEIATVRIVGIVISLHIAGMYALSPVVGWLTDRFGRRDVILGGVLLLLAACATAGTAGHNNVRLSIGLVLLGLGWSGTMVAGSTLFAESVPVAVRARAQGLSDLVTGMSGATAGALSGVLVQLVGYSALAGLAALALVPLVALALRRPAAPSGDAPPRELAGAAGRGQAEGTVAD